MMAKNISIVSIAERLGISASEVSRAFKADYPMKPEKRELIKKTAEKMGYVRNEAASRLTMKPIRFAFISSDDFPEFDDEIRRGVEEAGKIYFAYKLMIDLKPFRSSGEKDPAARLDRLLDDCLKDSYDAVLIAVCFDGVGEVIRRYTDRLRIALVNFDIPDSGRVFAAVNNTETVANIASQLLAEHTNGGKCAVFAGVKGHWTHQKIVESFCESARARGLDVACVYYAAEESELACQVERAFSEHPDITAIYATSAVSVPICEYIVNHGLRGRTSVVTSDVYERLNRYITDGTVLATMYQNPTWQAYTSVETMYRYIARGVKPSERLIAKPEIVISANLSLYK